MELPARGDVLAAARRIAGLVRRTPVVRQGALDELAGAELWLKAENLQEIGAFKARGAFHFLCRLSDEERRRGVITYSSGNHAQAVALAARHFGVEADVAMPEDAPAVKVDVVRRLGARVVFAGTTSPERHRAALEIQERTGGTIVEPFDHPWTIAGQGTATLELLEEVEAAGAALDALVVPVGGGGLIAGACLAADGTGLPIYAVEPVGCDSLRRSVEAGEVVPVDPAPTLADGLKPTRVGALNFAVCRDRLAGCLTVDDAEIERALVCAAVRAKLVIEPSAAAALAAALRGLPHPAARVGVILSGGNLAPALLAEILGRVAPSTGGKT